MTTTHPPRQRRGTRPYTVLFLWDDPDGEGAWSGSYTVRTFARTPDLAVRLARTVPPPYTLGDRTTWVAAVERGQPGRARFWVWWNGEPVRVTLGDGQSLSWFRSERHDEGWSFTSVTVHRDGDHLYIEATDEGKDCDGRVSHRSHRVCEVRDIPAGIKSPPWARVRDASRDYAAEAAGY